MLAAAILRRMGLLSARVYVHEQNAAPGKLNLLVGRLADRVFVSFPDTLAEFPGNGTMAGYPLRRRIQKTDRDAARAALDFKVPAGRQVVFAFGGSQGARTINRALVDALGDLLPHRDRLFIIHGTGLPPGRRRARPRRGRAGAAGGALHRRGAPGHRGVLRRAAVLPRHREGLRADRPGRGARRAPAR